LRREATGTGAGAKRRVKKQSRLHQAGVPVHADHVIVANARFANYERRIRNKRFIIRLTSFLTGSMSPSNAGSWRRKRCVPAMGGKHLLARITGMSPTTILRGRHENEAELAGCPEVFQTHLPDAV